MDSLPMIYDTSSIQNLRVLGAGVFSIVHLGELHIDEENKVPVAIKVLRKNKCNLLNVRAEIRIIQQLNHDNVCRMVGIAYPMYPYALPWILMEFMDNGNLTKFMRENPDRCDFVFKVKATLMVAAGMKHLNIDQKIGHGDLHGQNCLVSGLGKNLNIKVSDFGCSFNIKNEQRILAGPTGLYGRPKGDVLVTKGSRWKAPEWIPGKIYRPIKTRPGDVWSYAILLFEILNDGAIPFYKLKGDVVCHLIARGYNPLDFNGCRAPKRILNLIWHCFHLAPAIRPTFKGILAVLTRIYPNPDLAVPDEEEESVHTS